MYSDTRNLSDGRDDNNSDYVIEKSTGSYFLLDNIFVMGIIFAPMTALRIYKFGPGEMLLIFWMVIVFLGRNPSTVYPPLTLPLTSIGKYQRANLIMMSIGLVINIILYNPVLSKSAIITDVFSHIFMLLFSACMFLYLEERSLEDINKIIRKIVIRGVIIYGGILYYALYVGDSLFGIPLWLGGRGNRFLGLAINPHQIGMITGPGICLALYLVTQEKKIIFKLLYVATAYIWYRISLSIRSDTLVVTYVILIAIAIALMLPKSVHDPTSRRAMFSFVMVISIIALIFSLPFLWQKLSDFVMGAGNGANRIEIWNAGLGQFKYKPICFFTGLGPGGNTGLYMAISGNQMEAHNTYVQQILNSGIFICIYYVIMVLNLIRNPMEKNIFLITSVFYFILYGFGGNMNRRVLVWFTYTLVLILTEKASNMELFEQ